jgi:L-seryl-tRNA(Ser) seleniumtransferase
MMSRLSSLPAVEQLLQTPRAAGLSESYGRPLTLTAIRETLDDLRGKLRSDAEYPASPVDAILSQAEVRLVAWTTPSLSAVINATGVILHTNLGRAPLSHAAMAAMAGIATGYSNLEINLDTGKRGDRFRHVESNLRTLTGAEAALVVNNNASAVLLVLTALAAKKRVIIARSQLVEIGGGFRMPDVMKQSGAKLVEVGTTNKVRLSDYAAEFVNATLVIRVHRSNFKMVGFTADPELKDIARAAHDAGLLVVDDLGSGALLDTARYGMVHEPTVQESRAAGADIICFSGDKLVGGPQSGIIVGKSDSIERLRRHPLARAVRADKTCLAGLIATLGHYLKNEAEREIPVWRMISTPVEELRRRAETWAEALGAGEVRPGASTLGGGSVPGETMPTYLLSLEVRKPDHFLQRLRMQHPPIIARTEKDRILLDPRTVRAEEEAPLMRGLRSLLVEML